MSKYKIIICWSKEDEAFIAEVPELAGCMADGKTYQAALANAEVIIQEWIETAKELGRQIPEPKGRLVFAQSFVKYDPIKHYSQAEIEKAVKDYDVETLSLVVLSVALYSKDYEYAVNLCVQFSSHEHFNVRGNAIQGFGHIARIGRKLNEEIVKPIIKRALKDENEFVRGNAIDAKDDTKSYLKWKY